MTSPGPIQYKGEELQAERGPGLGCFRFQLIVLAIFTVLTPLSVVWRWPEWLSAALLFAVVILLLVAGQTIIFLLRLVAADRRTRRRPLGSGTRTVGELEDATPAPAVDRDAPATDQDRNPETDPGTDRRPVDPPSDEGPMRQ